MLSLGQKFFLYSGTLSITKWDHPKPSLPANHLLGLISSSCLTDCVCVCVCVCADMHVCVCVCAHVCVALLLTHFTVPGLYSVSVWAIFITMIPCLFIHLQVTEIVQKKITLILLLQWCETDDSQHSKLKFLPVIYPVLINKQNVSYRIFKSQVYTVLCITALYSTAMLIPTLLW